MNDTTGKITGGFCLLAKTMLVTLPFLFLLLDAGPLSLARPAMRRLLLEKLPLFGLSLAVCIATYRAQLHPDAQFNPTEISLLWRLINTPISYLSYLGMGVWPSGLACFYPHPALVSPELLGRYAVVAALASAFLLAATGIAISAWRTRPWLLVGSPVAARGVASASGWVGRPPRSAVRCAAPRRVGWPRLPRSAPSWPRSLPQTGRRNRLRGGSNGPFRTILTCRCHTRRST